MKEKPIVQYDKGQFLGSDKDMAHHIFSAYKVSDEIHIVYENGSVATEKIETILNAKDDYLWTPFLKFALVSK